MFYFLTVVIVYIFITEQRNCFIYDIELAAETGKSDVDHGVYLEYRGKGRQIVHQLSTSGQNRNYNTNESQ